MKITEANSNYFSKLSLDKKVYESKKNTDILPKKKDNPIQFTISEKGKALYRERIQELTASSGSYKDIIENRTHLLEVRISTDLTYDFKLGDKLEEYNQETKQEKYNQQVEIGKYYKSGVVEGYKDNNVYLPIKEKANNLLKAYTNLYDAIIQSYDSGTREINVQDNNSEKGYHTLTKEEEIDALNLSFQKYVDGIEEEGKQLRKIQKALDIYMKKLSEISFKKSSIYQNFYDNTYSDLKADVAPKNISEKLLDAASTFREQYVSDNQNTEDILKILSNMKVF